MSTRGLFGEQREGPDDRRSHTFQDLMEQAKTYAVIGTIAAALFTGGYNWRGVRDLETKVQALDDRGVKKDVLAEQINVLTTAMEGLRRELELMRNDHQRERRER